MEGRVPNHPWGSRLYSVGSYETLGHPNVWFYPLIYGFFALLASVGCMLIEKRRPLEMPRILMIPGDASYSLYLVHYAVVSAAAKVVYHIWQRHPTPLAILFLTLVTLAIAPGLLLHFFLEVPLLALMSKRTQVSPKQYE